MRAAPAPSTAATKPGSIFPTPLSVWVGAAAPDDDPAGAPDPAEGVDPAVWEAPVPVEGVDAAAVAEPDPAVGAGPPPWTVNGTTVSVAVVVTVVPSVASATTQVATPSWISQSSSRLSESAGKSKMNFALLGPSISVAETAAVVSNNGASARARGHTWAWDADVLERAAADAGA